MKIRRTIRIALVSAAAALATFSASAQAQVFRAFLSSGGLDTNPCTLQQPCRLLPAAIAAVAPGGEIWMLDSANYNTATVTIDRSVSILAIPGAVGSVVAAGGGPAISIAADNLTVALRNIVVAPLTTNPGTNGVAMTGASRLRVEKSLISGMTNGNGVFVNGTGTVKVIDSIIRDNSKWAVELEEGASGEVSGTTMVDNTIGGVRALTANNAAATTTGTVSDSVVSGGGIGMNANASVGTSRMFVTRSTMEGGAAGLKSQTAAAAGTALVVASGSMVTNNAQGFFVLNGGASIVSLGNNHISDNVANTGALVAATLQ